MTKEERDRICWQMCKDMKRGYDFGVGMDRWQVLAVSADLKKALIKIPGHTGWLCQGQTTYYSPCVYLLEPAECPAHGVRHREVMEVKRSNPLTKAALTDLMCKHGCEYTYEGMLEITSTSYCPKCCRNVGFWADHALSCESRLEATSE